MSEDSDLRSGIATRISTILTDAPRPQVFAFPQIRRNAAEFLAAFASPDDPNFIHAWQVGAIRTGPQQVVSQRELGKVRSYQLSCWYQATNTNDSYTAFLATIEAVAKDLNETRFSNQVKGLAIEFTVEIPEAIDEILIYKAVAEITFNCQK